MAIDPICKMTVDEKTAKFTSEYKGKKYYFCAPGCKKTFDAAPEKYAQMNRAISLAIPGSIQNFSYFGHIQYGGSKEPAYTGVRSQIPKNPLS